jgi:ornithine cyclodeaminase
MFYIFILSDLVPGGSAVCVQRCYYCLSMFHSTRTYYPKLLRRLMSSTTACIKEASNKMLILSESDVKKCLDMKTCFDVNRTALIAVATGDAIVPTRLALPYHGVSSFDSSIKNAISTDAEDWTLFKPAAWQPIHTPSSDSDARNQQGPSSTSTPETLSMGIKVVSIRSGNAHTGHPLVPATVLHINPVTGIVDAVVAATYLTAVRTAAGSALAIQHYFQPSDSGCSTGSITPSTTKRQEPQHVVVFGAGLQAEQHIRAIAAIFQYKIPQVTIINRNIQRAEILKVKLLAETIPVMEICTVARLSPGNTKALEESILNTADVIVTCTNTTTPLWGESYGVEWIDESAIQKRWNRSCIIASIGSYTPDMQEVPVEIVNQCQQIWIDTPEATKVGDLKHIQLYDDNTLQSVPQLIGAVLQKQSLDQSNTQTNELPPFFEGTRGKGLGLVFYKAVGTAMQDILTNNIVVERAKELGIGTEIDMT